MQSKCLFLYYANFFKKILAGFEFQCKINFILGVFCIFSENYITISLKIFFLPQKLYILIYAAHFVRYFKRLRTFRFA